MVMMFTLLQEQHKALLKAMAASNEQAMDMMFKRMNALVAGHGKAVDKVTAPPPTSQQQHSACLKQLKVQQKEVLKLRKAFSHKLEDCYKLKTNASKRWPGWKF